MIQRQLYLIRRVERSKVFLRSSQTFFHLFRGDQFWDLFETDVPGENR